MNEVMGEDGVVWLLTGEVAARERVTARTVERWIEKELPAVKATNAQLGALVARGLLTRVPPRGVYLVWEADLQLIAGIRAYPKQTRRPNRKSKVGATSVPKG